MLGYDYNDDLSPQYAGGPVEDKRHYLKSAEEFILDGQDLAGNGNPQTPVLFCVDCSYSMRQQGRLQKVMEGLEGFRKEILEDPVAKDSMELCVVSFQDTYAREAMPFSSAQNAKLPQLQANGGTPLGDAVKLSMELIHSRKEDFRLYGNDYYRPWLIIISDGDDTACSAWELDQIARELRQEYDNKHIHVMCITVGDERSIECTSLMRLAPDHQVHYLRDLKFKEFFSWLSRSIEKTSQSLQGEKLNLAPTTDWGELRKG